MWRRIRRLGGESPDGEPLTSEDVSAAAIAELGVAAAAGGEAAEAAEGLMTLVGRSQDESREGTPDSPISVPMIEPISRWASEADKRDSFDGYERESGYVVAYDPGVGLIDEGQTRRFCLARRDRRRRTCKQLHDLRRDCL
jgi:hypothetical protein